MATWATLTPDQRAEIQAAVAGGEDIDDVARRHELKSSSLARTLRELRAKEEKGDGTPPPRERERVTQEEHTNTATLESKTARIKTLDQLLQECAVDLDVWRVDHYLVNKWEVGAKNKSGEVVVTPLFQVKAWLVRRRPEPLFPTIRPVTCEPVAALSPAPERSGILRSLVWADPHFGFTQDKRTAGLAPFHDRQVLDLVVQIAAAAEPDRIDCLGDVLDLPEWTDRFIRSPEFAHTTQPALLEAHWWLAQVRQVAPCAKLIMYEGNHERRLEAALMTHLDAAYGLRAVDEMNMPQALSVPRLLALHKLGIDWVSGYPGGGDWLNGGVRLSHGERAQVAGNTAKAVVAGADATEIFGHIHRIEWVSRTKHLRDGRQVIAGFCPGCTCKIDGTVPAKTKRQQWQNGCAVVDFEVDGHGFSIAPVVIENGRAIWDGQLFEARDRLPDLREAYPDWNWE